MYFCVGVSRARTDYDIPSKWLRPFSPGREKNSLICIETSLFHSNPSVFPKPGVMKMVNVKGSFEPSSLPSSEMYRQWSTYIGCVLQCVTHRSFHVELEAKFIFPVYSHDVIGYVVDHGSLASSSSTKKHDNLLWRSIFGEWLTDVQFVAFHLSLLLTLAAYIQLGAHSLFSSYFLAKPSVSPNQWNLFQWKTVGNIRNMDRYT